MKNGKYLDSLSSDKKSKILKNIATHYGLSVADAEDEVRDDDAEMLYEYIANDNSLRMEVYNDMERGKYAKGGNMADVRLKYAKKDINLLIKNGMMSIYDTKYGVLNLSYENGKFIIKNNKYNPAKEDYETIFKGDKNDAIKFVANSYQIDEMAKGGKTKGGFKFKKYYEVGIDNDEDGTETLASFDTEKEAQAFKKAYESHHPKAKLFIDSATTDFMNENKQFAKGGTMQKLTEKDFIRKKKFKIGNVLVELEKRTSPLYYSAKYTNTTENEKIGSYGSPNIEDVIYDIRTSKFAKGGKTKKGKKEPMIVRSYFEDEAIDYAKGGGINYDLYDNKSMEYIEGEIAHTERSARQFRQKRDEESAKDREQHAKKLWEIYYKKRGGSKMAKGGSMDSIITDDIKQKFTEYRNKEGRKNFDAYEPILKEIESENRYGNGYTPRSGRSTEYNTLNLLKRLGVLTEVTDMRKPASKRGYYLKNNKMEVGGMTTGWCYSIGGL